MNSLNFERFFNVYAADVDIPVSAGNFSGDYFSDIEGFIDFFSMARISHGGGIIRFVPLDNQEAWNSKEWRNDWPEWTSRYHIFSYDWMGRQIAIDFDESINNQPSVVILDPGFSEILCTDMCFYDFITQGILEDPEAVLLSEFYKAYNDRNNQLIAPDQCIGYKVSPFLGGEDEVSNLEVNNIEVYLSLSGQSN